MSVTGLVGCGSSKDNEAGSTSASSDSDWAYIQDKGKLTVGITLFAPMNYYNEKNKLVGFDTEMAEAVTKKLGISLIDRLRISSMTFTPLIKNMN